jgi:ribosomal protein S18 acetylase RimI-like enzyme
MRGIEIINAVPGDEQVIHALAEATWWSAYGDIVAPEQIRYMLDKLYDPAVLREQILRGEQQYIILSEDGQPSGFAAYSALPGEPFSYKLNKLYVLPESHGKGLGRRLLDEIMARLRDKSVAILELNVNRENPALAFYKRYGFAVVRQEDVPIGPYWMNDYVMRLDVGVGPIA